MNNDPLYAEVILPLGIKGTFTYSVSPPDKEKAVPGMRVIVQLGAIKLYSGIISEVHERSPKGFSAKPILSFLDDKPLISSLQLQFWEWIASYYMCSPGEVMNAALPGGLKLASESVFMVNEEIERDYMASDDEESAMLEFLKDHGKIKLEDIRKSVFGDDGIRILKRLVEKGPVTTDQYLKKAYKPREIKCVRLMNAYRSEEALSTLLDSLGRAPSQVRALEEYVVLSREFEDVEQLNHVEQAKLSDAGVAPHAIKALEKKGVLEPYTVKVSRIHSPEEEIVEPELPLVDFQQEAMDQIQDHFKKLPIVLLHGVTSSGKTEIYIQLIRETIEKGSQVLYLLPEIALTTQIIKRLRRVFGRSVGVYHSKYSDNERVEVYRNLAGLTEQKPFSVILGVRSAVFLPFENLGLIIVDEEHENTYKQFDPAPRYHARDTATILGLYSSARVILGSATPSFESVYNATNGKYGLVSLNNRFGNVALPEIVVANVAQAKKRKQIRSHFTPELLQGMEEALASGKQVILFQNRRGYSNYFRCEDCGFILKCRSCDVSMTYHKFSNEMECHYCGYKSGIPSICPDCQSTKTKLAGFGTEKIEDDILEYLPDAKVGRLDLDKVRSRKAFEKVIGDFETGKLDVLVGTQLVTKGLDFDKVGLVGIIDADSMLNFPDFRAFERSFQLMVQVSGRAGRRAERGKVIIQTHDPSHPVIQRVLEGKHEEFYTEHIAERRMFKYPPFVRLIRITLRHEIPSILDGGSVFLANEMKNLFGGRVLGPQQPVVAKTHGKYIRQIILKVEKESSFEKARQILTELLDIFDKNPVYKQIRTIVDVDPA